MTKYVLLSCYYMFKFTLKFYVKILPRLFRIIYYLHLVRIQQGYSLHSHQVKDILIRF